MTRPRLIEGTLLNSDYELSTFGDRFRDTQKFRSPTHYNARDVKNCQEIIELIFFSNFNEYSIYTTKDNLLISISLVVNKGKTKEINFF